MMDLWIDVDMLMTAEPEYAEDAIDEIEIMINSWVSFIVVDSVAAMLPRQEAQSDAGDTQVMIMGRVMSKAMRKLTPVMHKMWATVVWLNQTRKTITMSKDNNVTTWGNALPFYASQRIKMHRNQALSAQLKDDNWNICWSNIQFTVVKNKTSSPFETLTLPILYDGYIDEGKLIQKYLSDNGFIQTRAKTHYIEYGDDSLEVGTNLKEIQSMLRDREKKQRITSMMLDQYQVEKKKRSEIARARYF